MNSFIWKQIFCLVDDWEDARNFKIVCKCFCEIFKSSFKLYEVFDVFRANPTKYSNIITIYKLNDHLYLSSRRYDLVEGGFEKQELKLGKCENQIFQKYYQDGQTILLHGKGIIEKHKYTNGKYMWRHFKQNLITSN